MRCASPTLTLLRTGWRRLQQSLVSPDGEILVLYAVSRLVLSAVGTFALARYHAFQPAQPWPMPSAPPFFGAWLRWDSQWYLEIARRGGYWYTPGRQHPYVFFPLYPLLIRWLSPLTGGAHWIAGLILANVGAVVGLMLMRRLLAEVMPEDVAQRAVRYLIYFPTSFFMSAVYTEGFFLALATGSLYLARRRVWWAAGLVGFLASLTRIVGVFLFFPLAWEFYEWLRERGLRFHPRGLYLLGLPLGLSLYMGYLWLTTGTPFQFMQTEEKWWGRALIWPGAGILRTLDVVVHYWLHRPLYGVDPYYDLVDLVATLLFIVLVVQMWRQPVWPMSFRLYASLSLLVPILAPVMGAVDPLMSMVRYVLVVFPAFGVLAGWSRSETRAQAVCTLFLLLQSFFFVLYSTWRWIA